MVTLRASDHIELQAAKDRVILNALKKRASVRHERDGEVVIEVRLNDAITRRAVERMFGLTADQVKPAIPRGTGAVTTMHRRWAVTFGPVTDATIDQLQKDLLGYGIIAWALVAANGSGSGAKAIVALRDSRFIACIGMLFDRVVNVSAEPIDMNADLALKRQALLFNNPTKVFEIGSIPKRGRKRQRDASPEQRDVVHRARQPAIVGSVASLGATHSTRNGSPMTAGERESRLLQSRRDSENGQSSGSRDGYSGEAAPTASRGTTNGMTLSGAGSCSHLAPIGAGTSAEAAANGASSSPQIPAPTTNTGNLHDGASELRIFFGTTCIFSACIGNERQTPALLRLLQFVHSPSWRLQSQPLRE